MKKILAAVVIASAAMFASSSAFAVSCTQQGQECKRWAAQQGGQSVFYANKCAAEVKTCVNRCKGGNKIFIGVQQGLHYPITDCR